MIRIHHDYEALSEAAAELFVQTSQQAVSARGRFAVALSGGSTPRRTFELLAGKPYTSRVDWGRVHVFWGDERCVPPDDSRHNAKMAGEVLLRHVAVPETQIHPILCAESPDEAAERYEGQLHSFFGNAAPQFDFIILGLGENGHTASLFPSTPVLSKERRWAAAVYLEDQKMHRVTLTAPLINRARVIAFVVSGETKAGVLRDVLQGPRNPEKLPAQLIGPQDGKLFWLLDRGAAKELS